MKTSRGRKFLNLSQLTAATSQFASVRSSDVISKPAAPDVLLVSTTGVDCFDAIEVHNLQNSIDVT